MAEWGSTTQSSDFDAVTYATAAMDARSQTRSGANVNSSYGSKNFLGFNYGGTTAQSSSGYSIVGIDANKVGDMRNQIKESVTNIQNYLDGIQPEGVMTNNAFKSEEIVAAVKDYIDTVKEYSKALISDLIAFSDKLQDVQDAWQTSTQNYASDSITAAKASMSDATTYYTEQK